MNQQTQDSSSSNTWMWVGKLAPPQTQLEAVPRHALLARLQHHAPKPLTLVISAPGFGKTTLLAQLRLALLQREDGTPVAWLSLDEADAEASRFLAYFLLALEDAGLDLGGLSPLAHSQTLDARPQRTVATLLQALARDGRRFSLMLDDYHRAACDAVDEIVLTLLERGSQWLHLVVASRTRPSWPLATLKARGLVHEVEAGDLVLSLSEASQILGPELGQSALATVHSKTEGWAVAVQLARLWLARGSGSAFGLPSFSGRVAEVAEYLAEQLLDNMPEDCREFLLETSLLERFNAELADVTRARNDSAAILSRLTQFEALLVPLDADHSWFRYHLLLSDFLRPRLDGQRAAEIHRAAAGWLAVQGDWVMAVSHALRANDTELGVRLVRAAGGWELVLRKGILYTQGLLQQFDDLTRRSEPELVLMQSYLHAKLGNEALAFELLRLSEVAVKGDARLERDFAVIRALVHTYFDHFDDLADWLGTGAATSKDLPNDPLAQGTLLCVDAVGALAQGRMGDAMQAARGARARMHLVASPLGENYCLMHEALALAMSGQVTESRKLIDEALALAETNFGTDSSLKALVGCFKAQHLYWQGLRSETQHWIRGAQDSLEHTDGWLDVFAAVAEISWRTGLRQHGLQHALAVLDHTSQLARDRHLPRLGHLVQAWRVDLLSQCGLISQAQREAQAANLDTSAQSTAGPGTDWRNREASALALARVQLATGAAAAALSRLERGADTLERAGLHLPALRLRLMVLVAKRRATNGEISQSEVSEILAPLLQHGLPGLLLEVGPAILPVVQRPEGGLPPTVSAVITQLRGWQAHPVRPRAQFSVKETRVLTLLASGQSNKAIARALDVSENTVKFHLKQIFQKLGVDNRAAAISAALQHGILSPEP
ncbi:LuxR family transcriptional regulator [Burkholderia sp. R-70006]|uniref:LuxR C-terminal-related transcriptional regulator n=1 Tax=Paraburkholderia domus TaxID=2793075 RepID=UPI001913DAA0|nr:LuxR C-terminal-related transcriptional regulator [Paraburkholderia domus]MBK5051671.1 LuxR family transcriptional regulator [Burkholderia sp. R-70006]